MDRSGEGDAVRDRAYAVLSACYDPEFPVNIVDMGLVYRVAVDRDTVRVDMTLTNRGCPMAEMITRDVRDRLIAAGMKDAEVNLVWEPPWRPDRITPAGRRRLELDDA